MFVAPGVIYWCIDPPPGGHAYYVCAVILFCGRLQYYVSSVSGSFSVSRALRRRCGLSSVVEISFFETVGWPPILHKTKTRKCRCLLLEGGERESCWRFFFHRVFFVCSCCFRFFFFLVSFCFFGAPFIFSFFFQNLQLIVWQPADWCDHGIGWMDFRSHARGE